MFKRRAESISEQSPVAFNTFRLKINRFLGIFTHANTADRTYTLPDATTTLVGTDVSQTLTNKSIAASEINSGTLALARGGNNADLSAAGPGALWQITNGGNVQDIEPTIIRVKNVSGSTTNANEVGLITYDATNGWSYNTTTTANKEGNWCVVVVGGANNADMWVARRGQVTVKLNANCSIGNFLATSTIAGSASVLTAMRPEVFAVALSANAGGAGGTCTALLLCLTRYVLATNANLLYNNAAHSTTAFTATINGAPSTTSVVYNTPSAGNADVLNSAASSLLKARLYNTTRGTFRLISSVNTGTKTITTVASTDTWASGDTINIESTTCVSGAVYKMIELDMAQSVQTVVPQLARAVNVTISDVDTAAGFFSAIHQFESFATSKLQTTYNQVANLTMSIPFPVPIISTVVCWGSQCNGTGTGQSYYALTGYWEAVP